MHIHFLGIAGTFMGNLAILAAKLGFTVSGQDANCYPPMTTALSDAGIKYTEGFKITHIPDNTDLVVVGNVMRRGMDVVEWMLDANINYISGPSFLRAYVLHDRHNLVVTGTHGKTTTTSMLAWILTKLDYEPGFLIGGVAKNFAASAELGRGKYFVIEGDEYDSAFFDKRAKFVHYRPKTLIITGIEYDHADIYPNLQAIQTQFHHVIRTVPTTGKIIVPEDEPSVAAVLAQGLWSDVATFGINKGDWQSDYLKDYKLPFIGEYNYLNATAAIAAAAHIGIDPKDSIKALGSFVGVKRRLEKIAVNEAVTVYDDFAHHPTAISSTLQALRQSFPQVHIRAAVQLGSNTMKSGLHKDALPQAVKLADAAFWYSDEELSWLAKENNFYSKVPDLQQALLTDLPPNSIIVLLSNRSFGGLREKLYASVSQ